jgi:hypothetical protein
MDELEFNGSSLAIQKKKIKAMRNNLAEMKLRKGTSPENGQSEVENVAMVRVRSKLSQWRSMTVVVRCAGGGVAVVVCTAWRRS